MWLWSRDRFFWPAGGKKEIHREDPKNAKKDHLPPAAQETLRQGEDLERVTAIVPTTVGTIAATTGSGRNPESPILCGSNWEVLTAEMKRYEVAISAAGHISYNAPAGYYDDCVIALALANQGRWEMGSAGMMARLAGPVCGKRQRGRDRSRITEARGRQRVLMG